MHRPAERQPGRTTTAHFSAANCVPAVACMVGAMLCGCASDPATAPEKRAVEQRAPAAPARGPGGMSMEITSAGKVTKQQLQSRLMGFVDRAMSRIEEATDQIVFSTTDPAVRSAAHETKYYTLLAMVSLAADVRPEVSVIDLMVMTRLERSKWAEEWCDEFMGAQNATALQSAQRDIEADIWTIGAEYLQPDQIEYLKKAIDDWRAQNPDRKYLTRVRFDNIAQMRAGDAQAKKISGGGFLAPVSEAAKAAEEIKLLGERALYLSERMPLLIAWQSEVLAYDLARTPEARQTLANAEAFTEAVQEVGKAIAGMDIEPGALGNLIEQTRALVADTGRASEQIRATVVATTELRSESQELLAHVDETLEELNRTAERFLPKTDGSKPAEFDPQQYAAIVDSLSATVEQLNEALVAANLLLQSEHWERRVEQVGEATKARIEHVEGASERVVELAFRRGLMLLAAAGATVFVTGAALRLLPRRGA
jgi:hypothetical protein